jgi:hypothetical protein
LTDWAIFFWDYHHHIFGSKKTKQFFSEWQRVWRKHFGGYPTDIPGHDRGVLFSILRWP